MEATNSPPLDGDSSDAVLARLQDNYTRQKRQVAAQKRKQADVEMQTAAAYYSDLPVTLELLSDATAALFDELEQLLDAAYGLHNPPRRETVLLQRIRSQVNRELRESMSFMEEGYTSGFEKILREGRLKERQASAGFHPTATSTATANSTVNAKATLPMAKAPPTFPVQETLSESLSLTAESLAVLLQCEVVRLYLYDTHGNMQCAAQYPYRAVHADPMNCSCISMMSVREVHHVVCNERLAINGGLAKVHDWGEHSDEDRERDGTAHSGLEEIKSCLLLPVFSPQGAGKPYGMLHAVNKMHPISLGTAAHDSGTETQHVGFTEDDEALAASAARVLGAILSRYPIDFFFSREVGLKVRRLAFPGDKQVLSLTDHLPPKLDDEVKEAAEIGQLALSRLTPILVHRVPVDSIYEVRTAVGEGWRRKAAKLNSREGTVCSVEFNLRCMNELWESSRDDNVTLHKQYRALEEEVHTTQLLLRNVLDGVAVARALPLSNDAAEFLHRVEMYGRSSQTQRMATYVSEKMLELSGSSARRAASVVSTSPSSSAEQNPLEVRVGPTKLVALQNSHARLNTVTPASLHFEGPNGVRCYTSDPAQKREQVRFIEELCRRAFDGKDAAPAANHFEAPNRSAATAGSLPSLEKRHGMVPKVKPKNYPYQRPFKL